MTKSKFDTDRHKSVLIEILMDIVKHLNGKAAFKGGTAAMMFYNLPRMSLDLDFDLLEKLSEEEIDILRIILRKHGAVKEFRDKRFTLFFLLDYEANYPNIKVEFNKRVWKNNGYQTVWLLGVEIKIADKKTMLSNKLVALSERRISTSRDLFDVHYFLKLGYPLNEKLIQERTGKTLDEFLDYTKYFIAKNYSSKNILQGLGEILNESKKTWAKDHLISETVKELDKLRIQKHNSKIKNTKNKPGLRAAD
ncbi:nucleotidyl transferase AbiEii/AbiGii toxin family protein [Patescibacteria group bacterium]|nr:nucleotidyl transferase AbiEii/AbiGii toxin family protein [Patescibacteria group bacterium]MBU4601420.1 nucleotidyl transferase AbiEii/AbiGii toxin family protein [Patescibacteria group bacterium]MCG2698177.1 nucleotidyl transferase AbiEii/AbiGii toxin family protein [Candidatus Parcubacteria bacterium]